MTELTNNLRSQGGKSRARNQTAEERSLQAMIAASRRPLLRDANLTPEAVLSAFKELKKSRQWFDVFIVGADRSKIPLKTDEEVLRRMEEAGGPVGFIGITMLGASVQAYCKPLKRGVGAIDALERASREATAKVLANIMRGFPLRADNG
jgi:hypothetical protein